MSLLDDDKDINSTPSFVGTNMYEELLTEIGFTKSEVAVYLALLELGQSTTGPIIKKANIAAGKAYILLDKLLSKGIVTYTIQSGIKYYQAKNPERLLDYFHERENDLKKKEVELQKIIPELKREFEETKYQPKGEIFEGVKGLQTFYKWILQELKRGEEIIFLGVPREANERFGAFFLEWHADRIRKGIRTRILYNHNCREFGRLREKMPFAEVRYMKEALETPAWIDIFKDYVVTIHAHGMPMVFLIKNKEVADSYRKYFDLLWKQADKQ